MNPRLSRIADRRDGGGDVEERLVHAGKGGDRAVFGRGGRAHRERHRAQFGEGQQRYDGFLE